MLLTILSYRIRCPLSRELGTFPFHYRILASNYRTPLPVLGKDLRAISPLNAPINLLNADKFPDATERTHQISRAGS